MKGDLNKEFRERLIAFQKQTGVGGQGKFEEQAKISNGQLSKKGAVGSDNIMLIKRAFPQLSLEWLFTGDGDMLLNEQIVQKPRISITIPKGLQFSLKQAASFLKIVSDNPGIFQDEEGTRLLEEIIAHGQQDSKLRKKAEKQGSNQQTGR